MNKLSLAISITAEAFVNKTDKGGEPYILHCLRVMQNVQGNEDVKCAAVMHDLLEDTDWTAEQLLAKGFNTNVIYLLKLLTRTKDLEYMDYIRRISHSQEAREIKLRDLEDNSCITRLKGLRQKDFERLQKYNTAYTYLKN